LYFAEGVYVGVDDAQSGNAMNNASYSRVNFDTSYNMSVAGSMEMGLPAIYAWRDHGNGVNVPDKTVQILEVDVPDEGRFVVGYRVSDNGDGTWRYAYALYNHNSHRSGGSFSVPIGAGVTVMDEGFHDTFYLSGEPYDNTDWSVDITDEAVTWFSPETHAENPDSNALRWGTTYTFWFDADAPPESVQAELGLFRPGTPDAVSFMTSGPEAVCAPPAFAAAAAGVSFYERAFDGYIDPAVESTNGVNVDLGIDTISLEFTTAIEDLDGSPISADAFSVSDTNGTPPGIVSVLSEDGETVTLNLDGHITLQEWTDIAVNARAQCDTSFVIDDAIRIGYLPADVDQSGSVEPFDLLEFRQYVNGLAPEVGVIGDFTDLNRDGNVTPFDLLVMRQLINGISPPATQVWQAESLP
jgi:hypothetical protein